MTDAVIVSTARTPLAKSFKGSFNMTHGATLGGHAVKAAVERAGIGDFIRRSGTRLTTSGVIATLVKYFIFLI